VLLQNEPSLRTSRIIMSKAIPIPSFSTTCIVDNSDDGENQKTTVSSKEALPGVYTYIPLLNKKWIMQLEGALQLHLSQTKKKSLSFSEFCTLVPKLVLVSEQKAAPPVENTTVPSSSPEKDDNESSLPTVVFFKSLSREERLWHDLVCVAVPLLYKVVRSTTMVHLESVQPPISGTGTGTSRMQEFRRLFEQAQTAGVLVARTTQAVELLQFLRSLEEAKKNLPPTTVSEQQQSIDSKSLPSDAAALMLTLLKPESTLEERVRARAQQREKHLQQAEQARKDPKEDRVAVADALFSHARQILRQRRRTNKKTSTNTNSHSTTSKCVLTFLDVVKALPDYSRREVMAILQEIQQIAPGCVGWREEDSKTNKKKKGANTTTTTTNNGVIPILSKHATVWIETSNYKTVRALLSGKPAPLSPVVPSPIMEQQQEHPSETTPTNTTNKNPLLLPAVTVSGNKRGLTAAVPSGSRFRKLNTGERINL
jgi:hypothetical protein